MSHRILESAQMECSLMLDSTVANIDDDENKENIIAQGAPTARESLRHIYKTQVSPKDVWWGNMVLLGFCPVDNERKWGTAFHIDMFEQANTKGMQVVLYFLLRLINRDRTKKAFKNCWPTQTLDSKSNLNDFKKATQQLICELEQEGEIPVGSFRLSHLQSFGSRFYNLLWQLSVVAVKYTLAKKYSVVPPPKTTFDSSNYKLAGVCGKAVKTHIARQRRKFVTHAQSMVSEQAQWHNFAQELETEYRSLTQQMNKVKEERKRMLASTDKSVFGEEQSIKRRQRIEEIKRVWGLFTQHYEANSTNRVMLNDVILGKTSVTSLNQTDLRGDLDSLRQRLLASSISSPLSSATKQSESAPSSLTYQECQQLLSINSLKEDRVDLLALLRQWNQSLLILKKRINSNEFLERRTSSASQCNQLGEDASTLANLLKAHQNHLDSLCGFNATLVSELPALQQEVDQLLPLTTSTAQSTPSTKICSDGLQTPSRLNIDGETLGLLPPTPEVSFDKCIAELSDVAAPITSTSIAATPLPKREDQERMVDSIRRAAKQRRPRLSIGSGRASDSAIAMKRAMFSRKLTDGQKSNELDTPTSPADRHNMSGLSDDDGKWGNGSETVGLDLSPLREMTAQFTLNLGLFSPFGGPKPAGIFPKVVPRMPVSSPPPASPPTDVSCADPLSFIKVSAPVGKSIADQLSAMPTGHLPSPKAEDDEAWLMRENSFIRPLQSFATLNVESNEDLDGKLGDEDVLAELDDIEKDDIIELDAVASRQDAVEMLADKLAANILVDDADDDWQEEALNDLSMALDNLSPRGNDGDQFSTKLNFVVTPTKHHDALARVQGEHTVGGADFAALAELELEDNSAESTEPELPSEEEALSLATNLREEARAKIRLSLGVNLQDLEDVESDDDIDTAAPPTQSDVQPSMDQSSYKPSPSIDQMIENGEDEDDGDDCEAVAEAEEAEIEVATTKDQRRDKNNVGASLSRVMGNAVDWSQSIESEEEDDDDIEEADGTEINMEAEVEKAGGLLEHTGDYSDEDPDDDGNTHEETALGDYSVLDITWKPTADEDKEEALDAQDDDGMFADLQEELVDPADDILDEASHPEDETGFEEECVEPKLSEPTLPAVVLSSKHAEEDDDFFDLDNEENKPEEWDSFCTTPAGVDRAAPPLHLGLSLMNAGEQLDETVMDGLLTPVVINLKKDDHIGRNLKALTPLDALTNATSPMRPRKKLSFSALSHSQLAD